MAFNPPQYISTDPGQILADCVSYYLTQYQSLSGVTTTLQPAQIEQLLINMFSYRETLVRNQINNAAILNLPQFSTGVILEALCALVGTSRVLAQPASCTIEFTLVVGHGDVLLPIGTRVSTSDGNFVFETTEAVNALSIDTVIDVVCVCQTTGIAANGYATNTITTILDPQSFVASATNLDITGGGSNDETDEQLRNRAFFAPAAFSVAGPTDAYKYFALSADPSIVDVGVTNPVPGSVAIYPLVNGGIATPSGVLAAVLNICNDKKIRPLTDTVNVYSPQQITYSLVVNVVIYANGVSATVIQSATTNLTNYTIALGNRLNLDVEPSILTGLVTQVFGVKSATPIITQIFGGTPVVVSGIGVSTNQYAYCTGITVNVTGQSSENG